MPFDMSSDFIKIFIKFLMTWLAMLTTNSAAQCVIHFSVPALMLVAMAFIFITYLPICS